MTTKPTREFPIPAELLAAVFPQRTREAAPPLSDYEWIADQILVREGKRANLVAASTELQAVAS